jgi:hypothetical protein
MMIGFYLGTPETALVVQCSNGSLSGCLNSQEACYACPRMDQSNSEVTRPSDLLPGTVWNAFEREADLPCSEGLAVGLAGDFAMYSVHPLHNRAVAR